MSAPRCTAVSVVVSDMAATMDSYRACGLDAPRDAAGAPHAEIPLQGFTLMFDTVATVRSFDAVWGQRYAVLLDPDGNPVDLCAPLPTTG